MNKTANIDAIDVSFDPLPRIFNESLVIFLLRNIFDLYFFIYKINKIKYLNICILYAIG